jgi:hypothetical protein
MSNNYIKSRDAKNLAGTQEIVGIPENLIINGEKIGKRQKNRNICNFGLIDSHGCAPTSDSSQYLILIRISGDLVIHYKVLIAFNTPVKLHSPKIILSKKIRQQKFYFLLWKSMSLP